MLCRNQHQNQDTFESFQDAVYSSNPLLVVFLDDLEATSNLWYDEDKTTYTGSKIDRITLQYGLHLALT